MLRPNPLSNHGQNRLILKTKKQAIQEKYEGYTFEVPSSDKNGKNLENCFLKKLKLWILKRFLSKISIEKIPYIIFSDRLGSDLSKIVCI